MKHFLTSLVIACLILTLLPGCETQKESSDTPAKPAVQPQVSLEPVSLFKDSVDPSVFELPSGALTVWRRYAKTKPALLLFSTHPFLEPLIEGGEEDLRQLILSGSDEEIIRRGSLFVPDPAFFPLQTVRAAIGNNLLSELIVVLPLRTPVEQMTVEPIRKQMLDSKFLTEEEAAALTLADGVVSGKVMGLPLRLVHPDALPTLSAPVLLHIDLGYFKNLYVNQVKTPAFNLLFQTAMAIRNKNISALAVTLSYSNQEIGMPLTARFLISDLAMILSNPALIDGQQPDSWKILSESMELSAMFMERKGRELLISEAERGQDDPAYLYALATAYFQEGQAKKGFSTLNRAVALDPGYGTEYLTLAETGKRQHKDDKALELLDKAAQTFPNDPFIRLQQVEYLINLGREKEALPILARLKTLPWSERVYDDMPDYLTQLQEKAQKVPDAASNRKQQAPQFRIPLMRHGN